MFLGVIKRRKTILSCRRDEEKPLTIVLYIPSFFLRYKKDSSIFLSDVESQPSVAHCHHVRPSVSPSHQLAMAREQTISKPSTRAQHKAQPKPWETNLKKDWLLAADKLNPSSLIEIKPRRVVAFGTAAARRAQAIEKADCTSIVVLLSVILLLYLAGQFHLP